MKKLKKLKKLKTGLLITAACVVLTAPAQADIVIAAAGPITGSNAAFGEQMRKGAEMAVKDINAAGGINGEKVRLEVGDDACDPKQAVAVANRFVNQGVSFVDGHLCSSSSIPASAVYNQEGIIQISYGSTNPMLTEQGFAPVFRVIGRDDQQGAIAGAYIAEHFKGKKIAIVHDKQSYSKGLADETKKKLNSLGITETLYETITTGEKDYSALVTKLKVAGIDVLYYGGYYAEAGLLVRQMREQGMKTILMSGDALMTDAFWQITGDAGEGTLLTFGPDPRKEPMAKAVVEEFHKSGYEPEGYTLLSYGAVQAYAQAVTAAKSTDPKKVADALHKGTFKTVLGDIGFDAKGDVTAPGFVVYKWTHGTYGYASEM